MSRPKIHFEVIETPANESNPEDEKFAICGIQEYERGTTTKTAATCKKCQRILAKCRDAQKTDMQQIVNNAGLKLQHEVIKTICFEGVL